MNATNTINEGVKTSQEMLSNTTKDVMDFYTTQFNVANNFYKNMFGSFATGNKVWNNNVDMRNNFVNPLVPVFDNLFKQMLEYNTTFFTSPTYGLKGDAIVSNMSKKHQDNIDASIAFSKNSLKTAIDAYNAQLNFSKENNEKVIDTINSQFDEMMKQNKQFWSDLMTQTSTTLPINNVEEVTDSITSELKKHTTVLATELSNHNLNHNG